MPTPEWMDPASPAYNANWENTSTLPTQVWVQMSDGTLHPTTNGIHLARWLSTGATVVEAPTAEEPAVEATAASAVETPTVEEV